MKAMILAAGLGTRLRPLTNSIPKALVEIEGKTMLEHTIRNLAQQGFEEIVVNVHHFADKIKNFLSMHDFGVEIRISDESEKLLDTGGGIIKASNILFDETYKSVLIHNVDILSNANLSEMMKEHNERERVATLLVSNRNSSRKLIFDKNMSLAGWHNLTTEEFKPSSYEQLSDHRELSFSGIYIINKAGVEEMKDLLGSYKYSVMEYFLHPDRHGKIKGYMQKDLQLVDMGKPANLPQASDLLLRLKGIY